MNEICQIQCYFGPLNILELFQRERAYLSLASWTPVANDGWVKWYGRCVAEIWHLIQQGVWKWTHHFTNQMMTMPSKILLQHYTDTWWWHHSKYRTVALFWVMCSLACIRTCIKACVKEYTNTNTVNGKKMPTMSFLLRSRRVQPKRTLQNSAAIMLFYRHMLGTR